VHYNRPIVANIFVAFFRLPVGIKSLCTLRPLYLHGFIQNTVTMAYILSDPSKDDCRRLLAESNVTFIIIMVIVHWSGHQYLFI